VAALEAEVSERTEEAAGHQRAVQETREKAKGKLLELKGQVEALQAQLATKEAAGGETAGELAAAQEALRVAEEEIRELASPARGVWGDACASYITIESNSLHSFSQSLELVVLRARRMVWEPRF